jgi:Skp family chaperone for outer membrane proteins
MQLCLRKHTFVWVMFVVIIACLSFASQSQAQRQLKVAVVDLQAVLDASTKGKAAKERLRELGLKLQEEIKSKRKFKEDREQELQKLREDIRSKGLVLNPQAQEEQ